MITSATGPSSSPIARHGCLYFQFPVWICRSLNCLPSSYVHRGPSIINRLGHPNFIVASIRKIVESSRSSVSCVARCLLSWNYFQDKFLCPLSTTLDSLIKYSFNYFLNIINFVLWVVLCACLRVCGCWSPKSLSQSSSSSCFGSTQNILSLPLSTILIVAN